MVAYTKVRSLNDEKFEAMEHLRYVPEMVLQGKEENRCGQALIHIYSDCTVHNLLSSCLLTMFLINLHIAFAYNK